MIWIVLTSFLACTTPTPTPPPGGQGANAQKGQPKGKKQKGKRQAAGKQKGKHKGKHKGKAPTPIGVAGPMLGELTLTKVEETTEAKMKLTFEGGEHEVLLGKVPGTCVTAEPENVGPKGKEQMPIWAVDCTHGERTARISILQVGDLMMTLRGEPAKNGMPARQRPVRRTKLAKGAMLYRQGQPVPVAKAPAPANPGAVPGAPDEVPLPEGAEPLKPEDLPTNKPAPDQPADAPKPAEPVPAAPTAQPEGANPAAPPDAPSDPAKDEAAPAE